MMWLVKVTPHEPHPNYPKYYGPYSHQRYAESFAELFDPEQATAEPIEFARKPLRRTRGRAPYMRGYQPPDPKPSPPEQAEVEDA